MRLPRGRGRGAGRGRGIPRMPLLGPRHRMMGTPELPPPFGIPRGPMRMRPGPLGFPRGRMGMGHPELPPLHHLPPHHGFHPGDRLPPLPRRPPGMQLPPAYHHMAPGPPGRPPLMGRGRGRGVQGRGGRGRGVKRLTTAASGGAKKKKNKLRTAESESDKPWINEALKQEIVKKYELYATAKEKMTDEDWQAWKEQRVLVGKMIHAAKLEYIGLHPEVDAEQVMLGQAPKTTVTATATATITATTA